MLTIFAIPKPFYGHIDIIQRNAIKSWSLLQPKCEIILFNDEKNTTCRVAKEFGIPCITDVKRDKFGVPLFKDVFTKILEQSKNKLLASVSPDVILMNDFPRAVEQMSFPDFLMMGRAWNLDVKEKIDFNSVNWEQELRKRINKEGKLEGMSAGNYWIFPRYLKFNFLSFTPGLRGVDNWLIYETKRQKIPVIDTTEAVDVIHQNHEPYKNIHQKRNEAALNLTEMCTLRDADWILTSNGLERPPYPRRLFNKMSLFYPWRLLLGFKRKMQKII